MEEEAPFKWIKLLDAPDETTLPEAKMEDTPIKVGEKRIKLIDTHDDTKLPEAKVVVPEGLHRVRIGNLRISYAIENDQLIILVLEILPHPESSKNMKIKWLNLLSH